ncbi:PNLIP [Lepeophtheirus salmonis]|uniref:PNLIP n=1 Tax=Lepeophtheirus salmonis TaxID=72036 RepID=A0A7R8CGC0_LEPSM|nr:PNLIP [Lepeophtheirus salmonis]CAF2809410.1 PNLIP [Lepeophtheirus salmonis]
MSKRLKKCSTYNFSQDFNLPSSKEIIDLRMKLYTRKNLENPKVFKYSQGSSIRYSNYDALKLTKTIVNGFVGNCDLPWVIEMRNQILMSAANTQIVGLMIAKFFNAVSGVVGSIGPKLHLIGFSLGAQVCGYAGSKIPNCSRISGLDPAGPVFRDLEVEFRLDKSDADFVDVIHTNGAYYLSGGIKSLYKSVFQEAFFWKDIGCSHSRAVRLYIESIKNKDWECFNTSKAFPLGLNTPRNANGELYLLQELWLHSVVFSSKLCFMATKEKSNLSLLPNYALVSIHSSFGTTENLKVDGLTITVH